VLVTAGAYKKESTGAILRNGATTCESDAAL